MDIQYQWSSSEIAIASFLVNYLVMPRVLALTFMCPILTLFSDAVGIFGPGQELEGLQLGRELLACRREHRRVLLV